MAKKWIQPLIIFVFFLGGVFLYFYLTYDTCLGPERDEYFKLPSSARDIQKHSVNRTRSCVVWVRFQMDSADLESFLSSTFIKMPLSSTALPQGLGGLDHLRNQTGWAVNTNVPYLAGAGEKLLDEQIIFIDVSSQDQYLVYLVTLKGSL